MQICTADKFSAALDIGRVRPGDQVYDHRGVSYLVVAAFNYDDEPPLVRFADGRRLNVSNMTFPVGVLTGNDREFI